MAGYDDGGWAPYVSVAQRRALAEKHAKALRKKGRICLPVVIEKRSIAHTFWGKQWCANLESYSDYENRLPRGRTYARNGSVVDLQIGSESISALVAGSSLYEVRITVRPLAAPLWKTIQQACAGKVASLVELLQGRLSASVMAVVSQAGNGLFPTPQQISFRCSCPDSASMCKHVAAALYGVGNRLDSSPELLFLLRGVDAAELVHKAVDLSLTQAQADSANNLVDADLSALFDIDLDGTAPAMPMPGDPHAPETARPAGAAKIAKGKKTISARELTERGVPAYMRQYWLKSGVLLPTQQRAMYTLAKHGEADIAAYLERRKA
ncbi:MAG: hypothetical protein V4463_18360 [Pseudomonadota bacterium]